MGREGEALSSCRRGGRSPQEIGRALPAGASSQTLCGGELGCGPARCEMGTGLCGIFRLDTENEAVFAKSKPSETGRARQPSRGTRRNYCATIGITRLTASCVCGLLI